MKNILNVDIKDDIQNQTIFFGKNSGIQRFDYYHYEKAKDLERKQRGAYWNPNEISLSNDILKYRTLPVSIQARFEANIAYQTLMDSGNNIGLDEALIPLVTSPEIMALLKTQSYFELIHSLSYAHNLITVFPDPTHIYDSISINEFIKDRVNKEIEVYTKLKEIAISNDDLLSLLKRRFKKLISQDIPKGFKGIFDKLSDSVKSLFDKEAQIEEDKKTILEALIRINALEGLKFYVSFLMTYKINDEYGRKIPGATKIIKLINFDEDLHVLAFQLLINILRKEQREGFTHLFKKGENGEQSWFEEISYKVYDEVYQGEKDWAIYLSNFTEATKEGEDDVAINLLKKDEVEKYKSLGYTINEPKTIPGLTMESLDNFLKYYVNLRTTAIGLEAPFENVNDEDSTIIFFKKEKNINNEKTAAQETEILSYSIGQLNNDIDDEVFESRLFNLRDFEN